MVNKQQLNTQEWFDQIRFMCSEYLREHFEEPADSKCRYLFNIMRDGGYSPPEAFNIWVRYFQRMRHEYEYGGIHIL